MQGRDLCELGLPAQGKMQVVNMKMYKIEFVSLPEDLLQHVDMLC